jgi:hypothetical protein
MSPNLDDPRLTAREKRALQVLIDLKGVYEQHHRGFAARALGVAILLVWQVFIHIDINDESKVS